MKARALCCAPKTGSAALLGSAETERLYRVLKAWQAWIGAACCGAQLSVSSPRLCARGTLPGRAARGRAAGGPPPGRGWGRREGLGSALPRGEPGRGGRRRRCPFKAAPPLSSRAPRASPAGGSALLIALGAGPPPPAPLPLLGGRGTA